LSSPAKPDLLTERATAGPEWTGDAGTIERCWTIRQAGWTTMLGNPEPLAMQSFHKAVQVVIF
jgi:hypothetical protein